VPWHLQWAVAQATTAGTVLLGLLGLPDLLAMTALLDQQDLGPP